jgi:hypothetical protein
MDALTLLDQARKAGLAIAGADGKLIVRGPKEAEPVVRLLAANKGEILAALAEATNWGARYREALAYWGALHPLRRNRGASLGRNAGPLAPPAR